MDHRALSELVRLQGKRAVVTGGAMGIGYAIAARLAEAGARVVVADKNRRAAEEAAETLGGEAIARELDVADERAVEELFAETEGLMGGLDILVNNAGIYPQKPVMDSSKEDFERIMQVNLMGAFFCVKAAAARMIAAGQGGTIINITSIDALHPSAVGLAFYDASKHGLWGFTKNLALELAPHNIRVNAIAPGGVATPGTGLGGELSPELKKVMDAFVERIPMGRMAEADEIGRVALFLASDLASYMTGSQIVVDGGRLLA